MKKLIEAKREYLIECDNCEFKVRSLTNDPNEDSRMYINKNCPDCGENLLTKEDYINDLKILKAIGFMNKWFSWLTIFSFKKKITTTTIQAKNGIIIVNKFKKYRRTAISEMRPYIVGDNVATVSISNEDIIAGSPKAGDMIARNPKNHKDQWLVAKQYFKDNFKE